MSPVFYLGFLLILSPVDICIKFEQLLQKGVRTLQHSVTREHNSLQSDTDGVMQKAIHKELMRWNGSNE